MSQHKLAYLCATVWSRHHLAIAAWSFGHYNIHRNSNVWRACMDMTKLGGKKKKKKKKEKGEKLKRKPETNLIQICMSWCCEGFWAIQLKLLRSTVVLDPSVLQFFFSFVLHRIKNFIQVWKDMTVREWRLSSLTDLVLIVLTNILAVFYLKYFIELHYFPQGY